MESRLVRLLSDADYFVEPNVAHPDPRTGKSREIDFVAEYRSGYAHPKTCVQTTVVGEAVNNRFPFVLLTERPFTPRADFESYIKFIYTPEPSPFLHEFHVYEEKNAAWENLYSQYCVLTKKSGKDEFMASHPDDTYGSLLKLAEYTEAEVSRGAELPNRGRDEWWRLFFWQPMLVVSGQLMTATPQIDGTTRIVETPLARLEFNWHQEEQPRTTVIEVVREDFLLERVRSLQAQDTNLEARLYKYRQASDT